MNEDGSKVDYTNMGTSSGTTFKHLVKLSPNCMKRIHRSGPYDLLI